MKIAIATNNRNKLKEIRAVLGGFFDEMLSLGDLGIDVEIEETGTTLTENALIKARTIRDMTGLASLADDSGLMCDALGGAPGVYSARYAGEEHDDAKNNALLLKNIAGKDRTAHFCSVIALCLPDGREYTAEGRVDGVITEEARGNGGFGYDPLFFSPELGKTFAEASAEEKNSVSHRGRALRNMELVVEKEDLDK
ncbi:MAG TPA: XTP/dITP diphosphatase [Candidatus Limadaptatus stercorigallinarum]|uniref:dITP/XTP pyrophosphatase n=1 Tax=Candidatus Limadaptatus stercorigallinarum TaxID=2840845 RepID=A0A9D1HS42_9FIRM|nr:XTP/dITP diphosphatase [Candidatus Limadaptatus stercorigallinarum]